MHVNPVINWSRKLGKKLKADLEILELAAIFHDYASILDRKNDENHHFLSASLAEDFLKRYNFPEGKIRHVQACIRNHRGSKKRNHRSIESEILASADAMSHFSELASMFFLAFHVKEKDTKEGSIWLKGKLHRSWKKIMPEGKKMVKKEHDMAMEILNQAIKNKN